MPRLSGQSCKSATTLAAPHRPLSGGSGEGSTAWKPYPGPAGSQMLARHVSMIRRRPIAARAALVLVCLPAVCYAARRSPIATNLAGVADWTTGRDALLPAGHREGWPLPPPAVRSCPRSHSHVSSHRRRPSRCTPHIPSPCPLRCRVPFCEPLQDGAAVVFSQRHTLGGYRSSAAA